MTVKYCVFFVKKNNVIFAFVKIIIHDKKNNHNILYHLLYAEHADGAKHGGNIFVARY